DGWGSEAGDPSPPRDGTHPRAAASEAVPSTDGAAKRGTRRRPGTGPIRAQVGGPPTGRALVQVTPAQVILSAIHPSASGRGLVARVLNASATATEATLVSAISVENAVEVDPLERPVETPRANVTFASGMARLSLGPWQLTTILMR